MTSWKNIKLASQGKRLGEDHTPFQHLVQRVEYDHASQNKRTHRSDKEKLFASFLAQNHAEANKKALKCPYTEYYSVCMQGAWKMEY